MTNSQKTFLYGVAAGAVGLIFLQNTKVSIGAITSSASRARDLCMDGYFTTSNIPGRCSYHGGVMPGGLKAYRRAARYQKAQSKVKTDARGQILMF